MTPEPPPDLCQDDLIRIEDHVDTALRTGRSDHLDVLGYGEISLVLGWPVGSPRLACKRLPLFRNGGHADTYGELITQYIDALQQRGVAVVPTRWRTTTTDDGCVVGYVIQPVLPFANLAPRIVAADDGSHTTALMGEIFDLVKAVVDTRIGLDAQLSNWARIDGRLHYFDVTTPLLADEDGRTRLDLGLLTSPLPAAVRPPVKRYVAPGIVAAYHRPRDVMVDVIGNLLKERLHHAVGPSIDAANDRTSPPVTREEIDRWYRSDARTWDVLLRVRRADRWWQRHVRRRTYPFLLPGPIDR